jgi:hypothetical protein
MLLLCRTERESPDARINQELASRAYRRAALMPLDDLELVMTGDDPGAGCGLVLFLLSWPVHNICSCRHRNHSITGNATRTFSLAIYVRVLVFLQAVVVCTAS